MEATRINDTNRLVYFLRKTFVKFEDENVWADFIVSWDDNKKFYCLEDAVNWINDNLAQFFCDTDNITVYENDYIIPLIPCEEGDMFDNDVNYCNLTIAIPMTQIENNNKTKILED